MTGYAAMGIIGYLRGFMVLGVLSALSCQPFSLSETAPPSSTSETSPTLGKHPAEPSTLNKSHVKEGNRDVSALKPIPGLQRGCTATAYLGGSGGNGNGAAATIRQGPGVDATVVATVPQAEPVVVTVMGETAPWLYIAPGPETGDRLPESGWVRSALLAIQVRSDTPNRADSTVPLYATPEGSGVPIAEVVTGIEVPVLGCAGPWLQVQSPGQQPAWLAPEHQCSNPFSPCP